MKEFAHAFSCAYIIIELWMNLGRLESTDKASNNCSRQNLLYHVVHVEILNSYM